MVVGTAVVIVTYDRSGPANYAHTFPVLAGSASSLGKPLMTRPDGVSSDLIDWTEDALHNL